MIRKKTMAIAVAMTFAVAIAGRGEGIETAVIVQAPLLAGHFPSNVTLQWDPSDEGHPTSYILEAGSVPGASDVFNGNVGSLSTLQAVGAAGTYFVRVRSQSGCGMSVPSQEITIVISPPSP